MEIEIQEIIDRETTAWNEKSVQLLLSIFHLDMVWVWPSDSKNVDPMSWTSMLGKFDSERWAGVYTEWFANYTAVRNERKTQKINMTKQGDGAFAIVDVDTLWQNKNNESSHWLGRTCKTYVKINGEWKMINQVGVLDYSLFESMK